MHDTVFVLSKNSEFLASGSGTLPFEEFNKAGIAGRVRITRLYVTRT